jgi:hydrogenase/urease accessory protein HupE
MQRRPEETDHVEVTPQEARAGATPHVTRYVLGFGLALVVIAFAAILLGYIRT